MKNLKYLVLCISVLLICVMLFAACDEKDPAVSTTIGKETTTAPVATTTIIITTAPVTTTAPHVHEWGEWKVSTEATCTTNGEEKRVCSCGEYETQVIKSTGHNYESVITAPTCTEKGYTTRTCSVCKDSYADNYVKALGHTLGDWKTATEATCIANGEEKRTCADCDYFETQPVKATGHNYEAVITDPTCTESGFTTNTCSNCQDSYVDKYVSATDHSFDVWKTVIEATCTENGEEKQECKNCDYFETQTITATGHNYEAVVTDPTCTTLGYTTYTCSKCQDNFESDLVFPNGHSLGEWNIVTPATCTTDGSQKRECKNCEYYEEQVIPLGHNYELVVTDPTCTDKGYTTVTCSKCQYSFVYNHAFATGHNFGEWNTVKSATCTTEGEEKRECKNCDHFETQPIKSTEHNYNAHGECIECGFLSPGLYDVDGKLLATWDELVNVYGMDADKSYSETTYKTDVASPYNVLTQNSNLTSGVKLVIPDSVKILFHYMFYECTSLKSITIPDSVTRISDSAFEGCTNLSSVTIGNAVTRVGNRAFYGCTSLTSVIIPNSVTYVGESAFRMCYSLTSLTIGSSVTTIGASAFEECINLTSVTIPDSVTKLNFRAFLGCTNLSSVTIGNGVTSIDADTFSGCSFLTSVIIPDNVTRIGFDAFEGCTNLSSVTIPDSVTSIASGVFYKCSNLTSITFEGTVAEWNAIGLGNDWNTNVPATEVVCSDGTVTLD